MWAISKLTKIRAQGVELRFFVLWFKICVRGLAFKIRARFLRFLKLVLFVRSLQIHFLRGQLSNKFFKLLFSRSNFLSSERSLQSPHKSHKSSKITPSSNTG